MTSFSKSLPVAVLSKPAFCFAPSFTGNSCLAN
jgi:hypothetical protein